MQKYNPNNPVYKYKSVRTDVPLNSHDESNKETKEKKQLPNSYGLYVPPPLFKTGMQNPVTFLQYVSIKV